MEVDLDRLLDEERPLLELNFPKARCRLLDRLRLFLDGVRLELCFLDLERDRDLERLFLVFFTSLLSLLTADGLLMSFFVSVSLTSSICFSSGFTTNSSESLPLVESKISA